MAISAQRGLLNGDFPLRYTNDFDVVLQPIFLYYTSIFYGAAGLVQIAIGLAPYTTILVSIATIALLTTLGIYATIRQLGGDPVSSGLAASTLPFSPYFLTDVFTRGAYAELTAWAAIPWVIWFFIRFCSEPAVKNALGLILTSALLIACHKIFFPWTLVWLTLIGLVVFGWMNIIRISPQLILCLLSALSLTAPYWANTMLLGSDLAILESAKTVGFQYLTENLNVLWPLTYTDASLSPQYSSFSLQLGPVVVVGVAAGLICFRTTTIFAVALATLLATLFACSLLGVVRVWAFLPVQLTAIQYPYRLLLFATTFGVITSGLAMAAARRFSGVLTYGVFGMLFALQVYSFWWVPKTVIPTTYIDSMTSTDSRDYVELNTPNELKNALIVKRSSIYASGNFATASISAPEETPAVLPVQFSRFLTVFINGQIVKSLNYEGLVSISLRKGTSEIYLRRDEPVSFLASSSIAAALFVLLIMITRRRSAQADIILVDQN